MSWRWWLCLSCPLVLGSAAAKTPAGEIAIGADDNYVLSRAFTCSGSK